MRARTLLGNRLMRSIQTWFTGSLCVILLLWACAANAASFSSMTLEWNPDAGNIAGYVLYWGTESGVYTNSADIGNQTSMQVTGLVNQTAYYFAVQAYDTEGLFSPLSAEVSGRTGGAPA